MRRIKVGFSVSTIDEIDALRGDIPRERWIRRVVEARVRRSETLTQGVTPAGTTRAHRSAPVTMKDAVADVLADAHPLESDDRSAAGDGGWSTHVVPATTPQDRRLDELAEEGRQLASQRDDLIAAGADPAVPIAPVTPASATAKTMKNVADIIAASGGALRPASQIDRPPPHEERIEKPWEDPVQVQECRHPADQIDEADGGLLICRVCGQCWS